MALPRSEADILTVPKTMSFFDVGKPLIYGAVGSTDLLERIAEDPQVRGAYVRIKEGSGIRGALTQLWNSVTNTEKLRQTNLS